MFFRSRRTGRPGGGREAFWGVGFPCKLAKTIGPVSKKTISRWVSETIYFSYEKMNRVPPVHTNVHSTMDVAASWPKSQMLVLPAICETGTWSNSLTFAKFYRLDFAGTVVANRILEAAGRPR